MSGMVQGEGQTRGEGTMKAKKTRERGRMWALGWCALGLACVWGVGCDGSGGAMKAQTPQARAKLLWEHRCAACHGMTGRGDGEAAPGLLMEAVPRDLSDAQWQAGVADGYVAKVIVEGGASVGLSHVMSPNPDLAEDAETVAELVKIVRGLRVEGRERQEGEETPSAAPK